MFFRGIIFYITIGFSLCVSAKDVDIEIVAEEAFPLQYSKGNQVVGPTIELVRQVLEHAGLSYSIKVMPWARAYELAKNKPNILILSMARTSGRESLFEWVGEVARFEYFFYTTASFLKSHDVTPETIGSFRIGAIRHSAAYQYLESQGFSYLYPVTSHRQNYEKLLMDRIDFFPASRSMFKAACNKYRADCEQFIPYAPIGAPVTSLFFALSLQTEPKYKEDILNAYLAVTTQQKIVEKPH